MGEKKPRKTDRRTLYTRRAVREALLSLLAGKEYADITIAGLCREAEINRGTFYLHYGNLREVLEELYDDVLGRMNHVLVQVGCAPAEGSGGGTPLCRFLRENVRYQPLFFSESLRGHGIGRLADFCWEDFVRRLGDRGGLKEDVLRAVFCFQLSGCLAVSKQNVDIPDERWAEIQCSVDRFLKSGFESLRDGD